MKEANRMLPPLPERMRPTCLEDYSGQKHIVGEGAVLWRMLSSGNISSFILWGPPGVGKTTLARIVAQRLDREFILFPQFLPASRMFAR